MTGSIEGTGGKPKAIPFDQINWYRPEWASADSEALVAAVEGYEFEVGRNVDNPKTWDWLIKATAAVSETPEVLDAGIAKSQSGGCWACKEHFNQYRLRSWRQSRGDESKAEPKPTPAAKSESKAKKPTESQMAAAAEFVDAQLKPAAKKRTRKPVAA